MKRRPRPKNPKHEIQRLTKLLKSEQDPIEQEKLKQALEHYRKQIH